MLTRGHACCFLGFPPPHTGPVLYTLTNAVVDAKYHLDARKERPLMYDRFARLLNAIEVDALRDLGHVVVRSEHFFLRPSVLFYACDRLIGQ